MRMMMKADLDIDASNEAIKDGSLPKLIDWLMSELKPEASYFYPDKGHRGFELVFDMKDPSQIPYIVEPLFALLKAQIDFKPVMSVDDLRKGLESWQSKSSQVYSRVQVSPH